MAARIVLPGQAGIQHNQVPPKSCIGYRLNKGIKFKILTLVYKCINNQAPSYLQNLLTVNPTSNRPTHSNSKYKQLVVPLTKRKTFADRSFTVVGLKYWNELPNELYMLMNLESFKRNLKTYLFCEAYS